MRKIIIAAAIAVAAFFIPVVALAEVCIPKAVFQESMKDTGWNFIELSGVELDKAKAIYNATPPASDNNVGNAAIVSRQDGGGFLVVGENGAYCSFVNYGPDQFKNLVKALRGVGV